MNSKGPEAAESGPLLFSFRNVSFKYPTEEKHALHKINLDIPPSQWVAVVGSNGSGKSTLAKHMNALLLPAEGDCFVSGWNTKDSSKVWDIRSRVGMVFQNPENQIVAAVVEEDAAFGPENQGLPSELIKERVDSALRLTGLDNRRSFPTYLLSGGQKQRLAVAGVLAMQCEAIILDEATAMLDPLARSKLIELIKKLHIEQRLGIIQITHRLEEIVYAERVIVMSGGAIMGDMTPVDLLSETDPRRRGGAELPQTVKLRNKLREHGARLGADAITPDRIVEALCQL